MKSTDDTWRSGDPYEYFMGRWSSQIAPLFLQWLDPPGNLSWLDLGCGTGALSEAIDRSCKPASLTCVDPSAGFLAKAEERLPNEAVLLVGSASNIPMPDASVDIIASGLALNFFPDLPAALNEIKRVLKANGTLAAYVWDYAGRMDFLRVFWDAAGEVDPRARELDEGVRFPICNPRNLEDTYREAGFSEIKTTSLDITTVFKDFDDYWNPFLGGQGPAPSYLATLSPSIQQELKKHICNRLPIEADGTITLVARAIAVRALMNNA
jgi:SAM-dependent methyltransferase